jgi:hypothetical protein
MKQGLTMFPYYVADAGRSKARGVEWNISQNGEVGGGVREGTDKSVLKGLVTPPWTEEKEGDRESSNTVAKGEPIDA